MGGLDATTGDVPDDPGRLESVGDVVERMNHRMRACQGRR